MFYGCTNLNSVTCLATDITAMNCTTGWLSDVAPTGTFYKPATMNGWELNSPNGIPVGWTAIPVVPGKFSVNADGDQIYFSQGNLQATTTDLGANWTWSFATNQWDYIGNAVANTSINGNGTVSTNGTVDLFGWVGASSTWTGAAQYGISNATATSSTDTYGNVEGEALKSDWGTQAISNGGGTANSGWRTLTKDEWEYLLFTRLSGSTVENMMNARYTCATINTDNGSGGVKGLILFPNNITIAQNEVTKWGTINNHSSWDYCTKCTSAQWTALAAKGCVFLPAAGDRFNGTNVSNDGPQGLYWSSSSYTSSADPAYCIKFNSDNLYADYYYRFYGLSVRLVHTTKPMGSLSYAAPTVVKTTADEPFTNPLTLVGDGTVSFAVSAGDDICTVDATGEVTLNGTTGTCIITATVTVPSNSSYAYATTTASYTLTVKTIQQTPLTFEAKVAGAQVTFTINATAAPNGVQYSTDGSTWIDYTSDDAITLTNVGDKVMFRGDNTTYSNFDLNTHSWTESNFSCTKDCYIYGNIMSLISKEGYATATTLTGTRTFCSLFYDNTHIVNHASKTLVLPATTLTEKCYYMMFGNCSGLTTAPDLPATTLANSCYGGMFVNCTGLTTAPELPATTLAEFCYQNMFNGCTNLTTAPTLPATTLAQGCYNMMFYGCSSLTTAPILPATTLVEQCYSCMFYGCSSLTTAPILPATTLVEQCYYSMFQGCSNLNSVTCLATTGINTNSSTDSWLAGVATTGTFTKNASTPTGSGTSGQYWPTGSTSGIPTGWTVTTPEAIPLTFEAKVAGATVTFTINATAAPNGVQYSTDGSTWIDYTSGDAITLTNVGDKVSFRGNNAKYATTSSSASTFSCSSDCYIYGNIMSLVGKENFSTNTTLTGTYTFAGMFTGNADLYNHPFKSIILPATTLANYCYTDMFKNCTSLTAAPALPATTLANYCYTDMFKNCTSLTAAPALPATTLTESCYYEMFADCTGLTEAPDLPATTLAVGCYYSMFSDCTNLVTAPALPATTLAGMCYQLMFAFCTSLTTAPALPATTLVDNCYSYMFYGCTQLNQVTCLATSGINSNNSTTDWLNGVATTGTFYKASGIVVGENGWTPNSASGIPTGWTTEDHVEGALHGKFSVSSTKQVYFSQGNLQATTSDLGTNWTWAFAEHQYDYIGNATGNTSINGNGTVSTNSTVDLFGWSTSSTTFGIHNSTSNSTYNGSFVDWGGNIGTGWRTLTSTEWEYIFKTRNSGSTVNGTSNARYTHATINTGASSVKGMILFPDGVTIDNSEADSWGAINSNSGYATQCTSAQWTALAAKGCVFLPAAGRRSGSSVIWSNSDGCYWSSSPYIMSDYAYYLYFGYSNLGNSDYNNERQLGMSVRLVRDAN